MEKEKIVNLIIERAWYKSILDFIQRAYKISDEEMTRYVNGCQPVVTEQDRQQILKDIENEENANQVVEEKPEETKAKEDKKDN